MHDTILSYLQKSFSEPIRDPLWKNIYLTPGLLKLIGTEQFQQLGRIRQLGPAFHVYPGAVHTRLNHSIGVFQVAKKLISSLIVLSDTGSVAASGMTLTGVKSFLAATLLHDVGHFPFTHSLKELPLKDHEKLSGEIILGTPALFRVLEDDIGADPSMTAAIIDQSLPVTAPEIAFFRKLLSGALDPDKLDYLNRDAYFCGVPYGIQDVDYIIDRLRIVSDSSVALLESGTGAIEHLLFSKYLMYRNVYWHRTVRTATAMIKKALFIALNDGTIAPEKLYGLDDEQFNALCCPLPEKRTPLSLISRVMHRDLWSVVLEVPYDSSNPLHVKLENLENRYRYTEEIRSSINARHDAGMEAWDLILDIPERVSFKADLHVLSRDGALVPFSRSQPVFTAPVIAGFSESLRKIRVLVKPSVAGNCKVAEFFTDLCI